MDHIKHTARYQLSRFLQSEESFLLPLDSTDIAILVTIFDFMDCGQFEVCFAKLNEISKISRTPCSTLRKRLKKFECLKMITSVRKKYNKDIYIGHKIKITDSSLGAISNQECSLGESRVLTGSARVLTGSNIYNNINNNIDNKSSYYVAKNEEQKKDNEKRHEWAGMANEAESIRKNEEYKKATISPEIKTVLPSKQPKEKDNSGNQEAMRIMAAKLGRDLNNYGERK